MKRKKSYVAVRTRDDFLRRFKLGEFGNQTPFWPSLNAYLDDENGRNYQRLSIRNRIEREASWEDVPRNELKEKWNLLLMENAAQARDLYVLAYPPIETIRIQGEVRVGSANELMLTASYIAKPYEQAMAERSSLVSGLVADRILRQYLDWRSYDHLLILLDRYRGHTIRFQTFADHWGTVPLFNTIYIDVRRTVYEGLS